MLIYIYIYIHTYGKHAYVYMNASARTLRHRHSMGQLTIRLKQRTGIPWLLTHTCAHHNR